MDKALDTYDRQFARFCESLAAIGFYEAVDQDVTFVYWHVGEDVRRPNGSVWAASRSLHRSGGEPKPKQRKPI